MVAVVAWRSVAVTVPSASTMVSWSLPLLSFGRYGGDDGVEEPIMAGLR
jgi:hypothetical protein